MGPETRAILSVMLPAVMHHAACFKSVALGVC